jgi:hypothetical protein
MKARQFPNNLGGPDGPGGGKYSVNFGVILPAPVRPAIREHIKGVSTLNTPGPGAYRIDRAPPNRPASFHCKHREFKYDDMPGPGKWDLRPRTGSEAPAYSLRSRINVKQEILRPSYSMVPSTFGHDTPKWSIFIKFEERPFQPPGPSYVPPGIGTTGSKFSITEVRKREIGQGLIPIGPGPGRHNTRPESGSGAPRFSMKARQFPPAELPAQDGPGGGKYIPDFSRVLPSDLKGRRILERFKDRTPEVRPEYRNLRSQMSGTKWTIRMLQPLAILKGSDF